jgi:neutral ceramidase
LTIHRRTFCGALAQLPVAPARAATPWKIGAARVCITPRTSLPMAGFADRKCASQGVGLDLYTRTLALEDERGQRAMLITLDLVGCPPTLLQAIVRRLSEQHGIARDRLIVNSSHTHSGPVVSASPQRYPSEQRAALTAYARELEDNVIAAAGDALKNMRLARLSYGQTLASFGVNRRQDEGRKWGPNYAGPADHDVPIVRVESESGALRALVFGYGCHNTSMLPQNCKFHGDYAGVAAAWLEKNHPGAVALFVQGAGGDVKPFPCGLEEITRSYGESLAASIEARLREPGLMVDPPGTFVPVGGPLVSAYDTFPLPYQVPTREQLMEREKLGKPFERSHATRMLATLNSDGALPSSVLYPIQVWQFGRDLTLIAMGGEVLSDYSLRLKREYSGSRLWVAGYCHESISYIPSERVLREGGYEGRDAMLYGGRPGPWAPGIEEKIVVKVHELIRRVQA